MCFETLSFLFIQAVSESLKTLADADSRSSSTKDGTSDNAVASSSLKERTTALFEHGPPSSEAVAESKSAADDVMVQIRAGKSEVGVCQQICQLFTQ